MFVEALFLVYDISKVESKICQLQILGCLQHKGLLISWLDTVCCCDLLEGSDVDDLGVNAPCVEEPDDLTHSLGADQLAAGQHGLHRGHHLLTYFVCVIIIMKQGLTLPSEVRDWQLWTWML